MSDNPWFKCYPSNFLNGIAGLSPNEIAVYTVLLMMMYDDEGEIDNDTEFLARRCNMRPTTFKKALDGLVRRRKLTIEDGIIGNNRAQKEIKNRQKVGEKSAENAHKRWKKVSENSNENSGDYMQPHEDDDAEPMPTRSQKPDARKDTAPDGAARRKPLPTRLRKDWAPTEADTEYARSRNFGDDQIADMVEDFRTYWTLGKGRNNTHLDWQKAWQSWVRKEKPRIAEPIRPRDGPGRAGRAGGVMEAFDDIQERLKHDRPDDPIH